MHGCVLDVQSVAFSNTENRCWSTFLFISSKTNTGKHQMPIKERNLRTCFFWCTHWHRRVWSGRPSLEHECMFRSLFTKIIFYCSKFCLSTQFITYFKSIYKKTVAEIANLRVRYWKRPSSPNRVSSIFSCVISMWRNDRMTQWRLLRHVS